MRRVLVVALSCCTSDSSIIQNCRSKKCFRHVCVFLWIKPRVYGQGNCVEN